MNTDDPCVFIVDDDEAIRTSLSRALGKRGFTTQVFASAEAFLASYDSQQAGCLVLDYGMPEMSGLDLQDILVSRGSLIPIIFITGHGGVPESVQAMRKGAIDFLEKPFRQETLVEQINAAFEANRRTRRNDQKRQHAMEKFATLTEREKEITQFFVSNSGTTSSKDVARLMDISPRTVDHHRARILEKMKVKSVVELVDLSISTKLFE